VAFGSRNARDVEGGGAVSVEDNKKTVQLVEEAWDRGDVSSLDQYFSPRFDNSRGLPPGMPVGLETAKMLHGMAMQSFPDRKVELVELIGEGNKVVAHSRATGTNKGGFPAYGAPANDAKVDFEFIGIYEFDKEGKISGFYGLNDAYLLGIQLGVITPPSM
jgi:predicted ester cyclase